MAVADLSLATNRYEIAAAWSRYLIDEFIERREAKTSNVLAAVFPFTEQGGQVVVPAGGFFLGHPPSVEDAKRFLEAEKGLYAYFVILAGDPGNKDSDDEAGSGGDKDPTPISVPKSLCVKDDYEFYLIAALVCPDLPLTWAAPFDGEKFGELRYAQGTFGGTLVGLCGLSDD